MTSTSAMRSNKLLKVGQVPEQFREPGILSGYRPMDMTTSEICMSLFSLHNETFNIWSHLLASMYFMYYTCVQDIDYTLEKNQPYFVLLLTCCMYTMASAMAHLFNAMSPLTQHICFMVDYSAISIYTLGATIANQAYAFPQPWKGGFFDKHIVTILFCACLGLNYTLCWTRFINGGFLAKLLRVLSAASCYAVAMLPCITRALYYDPDNLPLATSAYLACIVCYLVSAVIFGGHLPDVLWPGSFDLVCHSHSIFHMITTAGSVSHMKGIEHDMRTRRDSLAVNGISSPLPLLFALAVGNAAIITHMGLRMRSKLYGHSRQLYSHLHEHTMATKES